MVITYREKEILISLCNGYSDEEIAKDLSISVSTVKSHIHNLLLKLKLRDRTQLVIYAFKEDIHSV
jgi:NarL family two-component system response regulator LiaR